MLRRALLALPFLAAPLAGQQSLWGPHTYDQTITRATNLARSQPATAWEQPISAEGVDLIEYVGPDRALVGFMDMTRLGSPQFDPLVLIDTKDGTTRWTYRRAPATSYTVLLTDPLILLLGTTEQAGTFVGIDRETGAELWRTQVRAPFKLVVAGDRLVLLSRRGNTQRLEALSLTTGKPEWQRDQLGTTLALSGDTVIVFGRSVVEVDVATGTVLRTIEPRVVKDAASMQVAGNEILLADSLNLEVLDRRTGTSLWTVSASGLLRLVLIQGGAVLRLGETGKRTVVERFSLATGTREWRYDGPGLVVSPLAFGDGLVTFALDSSLVGLDSARGVARFVTPFPADFAAGGPSFARQVGVPDLVHARPGRLFLSRERSGVAAFDLPSGRLRWFQPDIERFAPAYDYTAQGRYEFLLQNLALLGREEGAPPANLSVHSSDRQVLPLLQSAEREYRAAQARYSVVQSETEAGSGARQAAARRLRFAAEAQLTATQVDVTLGRMQAGTEMAFSMLNFALALAASQQRAAEEALVARVRVMMDGAFRAQQRVFQGDWYLRPFYKRGRGVTLVSLETGKRRDVVVSPHNDPLMAFLVDLPVFTVSPDGRQLLAAGISLRSERYTVHQIPRTRLPNLSILAYDLPAIPLIDKTRDWSRLADIARGGDTAWARRVLDSGTVDVDARHWAAGDTPLMFAAAGGHPDMVRLLLARGADMNAVNDLGKTATDLAASGASPALDLPRRPRPSATVSGSSVTHDLFSLTLPAGWRVKPPPPNAEPEFLLMIAADSLGANLMISGSADFGRNRNRILEQGRQSVFAAVPGAIPERQINEIVIPSGDRVALQGLQGTMLFAGKEVQLGAIVAATKNDRRGLMFQLYFPAGNGERVGREFGEILRSLR